jgi:hypothetical protein
MKAINAVANFGAHDADSDTLLFDCFEDHESYEALLRREKFLILGRKGAGKTAIFKKLLSTHSPNVFSYGHTFTDYPWDHHSRQKRSGVPESEAYYHSWTFLILMSVAKIALNMDQSLPLNAEDFDRLASVERFVIDSYGSRDPDLTEVFKPHNRLKVKPHLKINFGVLSGGIDLENLSIDDLPRFYPEINRTVMAHLICSLHPDHEYHVCFDQLDLDFDPENADYRTRLIGLILAARRLNQYSRDNGKKLFVSIFLRSDIYDVLQFEDKNKVTENDSTRIEWDTSRTEHTLRELMEKRFTVLMGEGTTVEWSQVFSGAEMTSRQKQYDYILARTYSRPRDMIKYCNEVLLAYKKRAAARATERLDQFVNDDILNARNEYSIYFLNEIDDELHKQLPEYKKYLELLKAIGQYQFDRSTFADAFARRAVDLGIAETSLDVLKALYAFSIIGYRKTGGRSGGSEWVFAYLDPRSRFDEEASLLRVHYGLIEVLDLKRAQRGAAGDDDLA